MKNKCNDCGHPREDVDDLTCPKCGPKVVRSGVGQYSVRLPENQKEAPVCKHKEMSKKPKKPVIEGVNLIVLDMDLLIGLMRGERPIIGDNEIMLADPCGTLDETLEKIEMWWEP